MAGPNPIGDLIQGKQGLEAGRILLDHGKQLFDAAEQKNNNSGTGAKIALKPYMESLKIFETENGNSGNADMTIPAIAAQSSLAGYDGGGLADWLSNGHQMNGDTLLAAQKTYAATYDKRTPDAVAKSVLQSLHIDPAAHPDALPALKGMDQDGLKVLDQRAKALAKAELKSGDVDGTAAQRITILRDTMLATSSDRVLQGNDLQTFKGMLGKVGGGKVNPQDLDGSAWRKAFLAVSSEGDGYTPSGAIAKVASHINWDSAAPFDTPPMPEAAPPALPAPVMVDQPAPGHAAPSPVAAVDHPAPAVEATKSKSTKPVKKAEHGPAGHRKRKSHYAGNLRSQPMDPLHQKVHVAMPLNAAGWTAQAGESGPATQTVRAWGMDVQVPATGPAHQGGSGNPVAEVAGSVGKLVGGIVAIPVAIVEGVAQGVGTVLNGGGKAPAGGYSYGSTYNGGASYGSRTTWKP